MSRQRHVHDNAAPQFQGLRSEMIKRRRSMGNDQRRRLATQIDAHMSMMCQSTILDPSDDGEATTWLEPVADTD
jgi:hypothetical protein